MIEFFREGGFGMWPILFIGLVLLGASGQFAYKPDTRRLGFLGALSLSVVLSTLMATWTDLGAVFYHVANDERFRDAPDRGAIILQGLAESTRPGAFGFSILAIASLLVAAGMSRRPAEAKS